MKEVFVEGRSLPESYHKALQALNTYGQISNCSDWDCTQKEISLTMVVTEPLSEPRISKLCICSPESLEQYDVILLGYPIWHGQAPKIMYTLVEGLNLSGKTVVPFCTSASSSAGSSAENLRKLTDGSANWLDVWRVANRSTTEDVRAWTMSLDLGA